VLRTRAGFLAGDEVVEVEFDPEALPFARLVELAERRECATRVFARSDAQLAAAREIVGERAVANRDPIRPDAEPKYYLGRTPLRHVPMTELQAMRIDARLGGKADGKPEELLSPRQRELLEAVRMSPEREWPVLIGRDVSTAGEAFDAARRAR
jgi:hypothetical protein